MINPKVLFKSTMHAWDVKYVRDYYQYMLERTDDPAKIKIWAFKPPRQDRVWAYVVICDRDWRDIQEGHIKSAIADGWIPEEIKLDDLSRFEQES